MGAFFVFGIMFQLFQKKFFCILTFSLKAIFYYFVLTSLRELKLVSYFSKMNWRNDPRVKKLLEKTTLDILKSLWQKRSAGDGKYFQESFRK